MRRGAKPAKAKAEAKPPVARKSLKSADSRVGDLEKQLAEALEREAGAVKREAEARDQQTATSEILSVISRSQTDVQPVFDAIVQSALGLCGADRGTVYRFDGELIHIAAQAGYSEEQMALYRRIFPLAASMQTALGKSVLTRRTVHVEDTLTERRYTSDTEAIRVAREVLGYRTVLAVPMVHRDQALGIISVTRREQLPFSPKQIALVETFADQAVIAVENVRLFNETKEALEQQTATAEILRVISSSPTDYQPVFDAIVRTAGLVCGAVDALLWTTDGDELVVRAHHGPLPATIGARQPMHGSVAGYAVHQARVVHVKDLTEADDFPVGRDLARRLGWRTTLSAPLLGEGVAIGAILIRRSEVRPFSDQQIALLQTFADQAVIAIENVRLFKELDEKNRALTEALEQQTATAEILRVIASSPTDVRPVFKAILKRAATLCEAQLGHLWLYEGGEQFRLGAGYGSRADHLQWLQQGLHRFGRPFFRESGPWRVGQVLDVRDTEPYRRGEPVWIRTADHEGMRTLLAVPLVKDGRLVGSIAVYRREVRPFTDAQVELVKTFADQAVIAIENVRLFNETKEALEQQTATSDILSVISRSPTDVQPVFDAVAESAARLCEAQDASIFRRASDQLLFAAHHGPIPFGRVGEYSMPLVRETLNGRCVLEGRTMHVADVHVEEAEFPQGSALARRWGYRTVLTVPLMRDRVAIGSISLRRTEVKAFTERQIALLQTFADQAVIAIENVRLFTELQGKNRALTQAHAQVTEALEQQTATSEILQVISRMQTDVQPVFDAIADSAARLCQGDLAGLFRVEDGQLHEVSTWARLDPGVVETLRRVYPRPLDTSTFIGRAIVERRVVQVADMADPAAPQSVVGLQRLGFRSQLNVPMLRGGEPIGGISVVRRTPGLFSDDQIQLLKTFADQAVIAIENARLLTELQARTQELSRSVEQLTALGEVGRAVSSSLDRETVLTTIVSRAVELSGLDGGVVFEYDEDAEEFVQRAQTETGGALVEARRTNRIRKGEGVLGQTAITLESVQVSDITLPGAYAGRLRENLIESGIRAILAVPMVYEGRLIGCLGVTRNRPGNFPNETIELLRTFATQSVLAIQNARLFHEIEDKSRQLEAASQHKSEFLANMSHELRTPLNAIIGFSEVLTERMFGELNEKQDEYLKDIYASGQHLLSLINDILDLSKIEAGRMELEVVDFDLPSAIENALILVRERASRRGITLGHSVDERLGQIRGDERKVKQVLLNLLSNALKFTPEGGRIDVGAQAHDGVAEIAVTDTGVGIAPEDQEAVFEEFRQVGTADKKVEGTGLGLALSRKFIELHGGRIWVQSQVGQGSTFTFTLPVR